MSGRGAERILRIIEWMAERTEPAAFVDVVNALSLPKSSALDLLRLLVETGYIRRREDGRYSLIRLPGEPSHGRGAWGTLLRHAEEPLRNAVHASGESGFIAVLDDDFRLRYILKHLPQREILYDRDVRAERRPHQVSSGIILLGGLTDSALRDYARTELAAGRLQETEDSLIARVAAAREAGLQVNRRGVVEGAGGMAAPIRNRDGAIIAAFNIAGPAERLALAIPDIEPIVRAAAAAITKSLGGSETTRDDPPSKAKGINP